MIIDKIPDEYNKLFNIKYKLGLAYIYLQGNHIVINIKHCIVTKNYDNCISISYENTILTLFNNKTTRLYIGDMI